MRPISRSSENWRAASPPLGEDSLHRHLNRRAFDRGGVRRSLSPIVRMSAGCFNMLMCKLERVSLGPRKRLRLKEYEAFLHKRFREIRKQV